MDVRPEPIIKLSRSEIMLLCRLAADEAWRLAKTGQDWQECVAARVLSSKMFMAARRRS